MAITYANDTVTVTGAYKSGQFTTVSISGSNLTGTVKDTSNSFSSSDKKRLMFVTGGAGAGTILTITTVFGSTLIVEKTPGFDQIDTTSTYIIPYTLDDIKTENTNNAWGIIDELNEYTILNADVVVGDNTTSTGLHINGNLNVILPVNTTMENRDSYFTQKSNSAIVIGTYSSGSNVFKVKEDFVFKIDVGSNDDVGNTGKEVFSNDNADVYDSTKFFYVFGGIFSGALNPSNGYTRYIKFAFEGKTRIYYSSMANVVGANFWSNELYFLKFTIHTITSLFYGSATNLELDGLTGYGYNTGVVYEDVTGTTDIKNTYFDSPGNKIVGFYLQNSDVINMTHRFIDCEYWFGSYKTTQSADGDDFYIFSRYASATNTFKDANLQEVKTVKFNVIDNGDLAIEDLRLYIKDKNDLEVTNLLTDSSGTHTEQNVVIFEAIGQDTTTSPYHLEYDYFPHTFRFRKYGKTSLDKIESLTRPKREDVKLLDNPYITEATEATVAAYTGISIDTGTEKITLTSNHSIQELYDYIQWWGTQQTNIQYDELITTTNGESFISIYNIELNNCTLSGSGNLDLSGASKTYTTIGTGSSTLTIKDSTGTYTKLEFTNVPDNTEVRVYKVSDDSEVDGIENSSGGTVTFPYTHTADLNVYAIFHNLSYNNMKIDSITLTNTGVSIPVNLVVDRNYNNP